MRAMVAGLLCGLLVAILSGCADEPRAFYIKRGDVAMNCGRHGDAVASKQVHVVFWEDEGNRVFPPPDTYTMNMVTCKDGTTVIVKPVSELRP